jgi:hypothetical protein
MRTSNFLADGAADPPITNAGRILASRYSGTWLSRLPMFILPASLEEAVVLKQEVARPVGDLLAKRTAGCLPGPVTCNLVAWQVHESGYASIASACATRA